MSPTRLRLLLRDASAVAAFASMSVSDQLPRWVTGLFLGGALLALLGWRMKRPFLGNALLLTAFAWLVMTAASGSFDLIVATSSFAALLTVHRLHAPPAPDVDGHVHLAGLLMVAGGAALSADLRFLAGLIAFAVLAAFSTAAAVLEGSAEAAEEATPLRYALPRLSLGVLGMLAGALLLFLALPRLSWNVAARTSGSNAVAAQGFSGEVQLTSGGSGLKTNPRPVLRAHLHPDPGVAQLERYWAGRALDHFDGQRWWARGTRERPRLSVVLRPEALDQVEQEIELLPAYGTTTLVALETPTAFWDARVRRLVSVTDEQVHLDGLPGPLTYHARSAPDTPALLARSDLSRYTALPPQLDPRIKALADRVLAKESDPARAAGRLAAFLQREYSYSMEPPAAATEDPLADFLFTRRKGHCEYFATALAVLLRTHGFATRVMTGFFGGERVEDGYLLRAADAHAWVQVWIPERGFVTFDATPEAYRAGQPSRTLAWLAQSYDALERLWRTQVVDYAFVDQVRSLQWVAGRLSRSAPSAEPRLRRGLERLLLAVLGLALGLGLLVWAWRQTRPSDEAARLGLRLARMLRNAPLSMEPHESLEDYLSRLLRSSHGATLSVPRVLRRYLEARFGTRPLAPGEASTLERLLRTAVRR
jgi:transglutaminase-like putative cysteine protease